MAILRAKDVHKMDAKARMDKLKDLRMELARAHVTANKTNAKTKEIKRAIARLLTFETFEATKSREVTKQK